MLYTNEEFLSVRKEFEELVDFPIKELMKESGLTRPTVQSWYYQEEKILVSTKTTMWIAITNLVERRKEEFAKLRSGLKIKTRSSKKKSSSETKNSQNDKPSND